MRVGVDVGGTFIDLVAETSDGDVSQLKVLARPDDLVGCLVDGLSALARSLEQDLTTFIGHVDELVHGTTITTNAVISRTGAKTGLLTTEGLRDALQMRKSKKEEPYNLRYQAPEPVVPRHLRRPILERLDYAGNVLRPLDLEVVNRELDRLAEQGVEAIAVCFMHSYLNPSHEQAVIDLITSRYPATYVVGSADLVPQVGFYDRVSTTALSAYVGPRLHAYLTQLVTRLDALGFRGTLLLMKSNGGVINAQTATRKAATTLLSGPAGGPRAALRYVEPMGYDRCITMDMGGTSFDTCLVSDGKPTLISFGEIDRLRVAVPMIDIHTVGAGGGSIAWLDDAGLLRIGPTSAGAVPGPACYGLGGVEPTCTDADLVLGFLNPSFLAGSMPLSPTLAEDSIARVVARPLGISVEQAAAGMFDVVNVNMAAAISEVSIGRGYDPREFPLVVGGGAGPIHAAMIAEELGIRQVVIPSTASVLCAVGMLYSDLQHDYVRTVWRPEAVASMGSIREAADSIREEALRDLEREGIASSAVTWQFNLDMRYVGQYHQVAVPFEILDFEQWELVIERFEALHDRFFGHTVPNGSTEVVHVRASAIGRRTSVTTQGQARPTRAGEPLTAGYRRAYLPNRKDYADMVVFDGQSFQPGAVVSGPSLVDLPATTIMVPEGAFLRLGGGQAFLLELSGIAS